MVFRRPTAKLGAVENMMEGAEQVRRGIDQRAVQIKDESCSVQMCAMCIVRLHSCGSRQYP